MELHDAFAKTYDEEKDYGIAEKHYLRGTNQSAHAAMLLKWSKNGFNSESDLFIARTVFQYVFQEYDKAF